MPKAFDRCVSGGGRVRTIHVKKTRCKKICFNKRTGKSFAGHTFKCKPKKHK
jgi:hypothetical protein